MEEENWVGLRRAQRELRAIEEKIANPEVKGKLLALINEIEALISYV